MTATKNVFGYPTEWVYSDTKEPVGSGDTRPCPKCGKMRNPDGTDPCWGMLPSDLIVAACCGHGIKEPWVLVKSPFLVQELLKGKDAEKYVAIVTGRGEL